MFKESSSRVIICTTCLLVAVILLYVFAAPKMRIADTFFGGVPTLYNTKVAQFFYEQALRFDTRNETPPLYAHYQLSRVAFIEGDLTKALEEIEKELLFHPENIRTYYIKGLTLGYMNREQEAIEAFARFIEDKPESWAARNDKAWLHFRIGEIDEAIETLFPATELYPDNPWVLNTYGVLIMNKGQYSEAEVAFRRALSVVDTMKSEDWGRAYPGNSPQIYEMGLNAMKKSIQENIALVETQVSSIDDN